jgi:hypothetical protein
MIQMRWMMVAAMCFLAVACERKKEPREHPVQSMRTSAAIVAIALARCDREQRCGNIGNGQRYSSRNVCMTSVRDDWKDDLNAYECRAGVKQDELADCVHEIRDEDCRNPLDALQRMAACRSSDICVGT